jgi:2-keto-3-deoxy-6-phosphogluconate aldolase
MNKSIEILRKLKQRQLIALFSPLQAGDCLQVYTTLAPLGIVLEIAFRTQAALDGIKTVLEADQNALILAGTVMTVDQAREAVKSGVAGVVSADYIPEVVEYCVKKDIMCVPGGLSDVGKQLALKSKVLKCSFSELFQLYPQQWIYKLFPAITPQTAFYEISKTWQGPYKDLTVIYTGGISLSNLPKLVQNDPRGIFCGSALTKDFSHPDKLIEEAHRWIEVVDKYKQK